MQYGKPRLARIFLSLALSIALSVYTSSWAVVFIAMWSLGVVLRIWDLLIAGGPRFDRTLFMNGRTMMFDFALRGYFRVSPREPVGF